jgi:hypothetical protein
MSHMKIISTKFSLQPHLFKSEGEFGLRSYDKFVMNSVLKHPVYAINFTVCLFLCNTNVNFNIFVVFRFHLSVFGRQVS